MQPFRYEEYQTMLDTTYAAIKKTEDQLQQWKIGVSRYRSILQGSMNEGLQEIRRLRDQQFLQQISTGERHLVPLETLHESSVGIFDPMFQHLLPRVIFHTSILHNQGNVLVNMDIRHSVGEPWVFTSSEGTPETLITDQQPYFIETVLQDPVFRPEEVGVRTDFRLSFHMMDWGNYLWLEPFPAPGMQISNIRLITEDQGVVVLQEDAAPFQERVALQFPSTLIRSIEFSLHQTAFHWEYSPMTEDYRYIYRYGLKNMDVGYRAYQHTSTWISDPIVPQHTIHGIQLLTEDQGDVEYSLSLDAGATWIPYEREQLSNPAFILDAWEHLEAEGALTPQTRLETIALQADTDRIELERYPFLDRELLHQQRPGEYRYPTMNDGYPYFRWQPKKGEPYMWDPSFLQQEYCPIQITMYHEDLGQHWEQPASPEQSVPLHSIWNVTDYTSFEVDFSGASDDPNRLHYALKGNTLYWDRPLPAGMQIQIRYPVLLDHVLVRAQLRHDDDQDVMQHVRRLALVFHSLGVEPYVAGAADLLY